MLVAAQLIHIPTSLRPPSHMTGIQLVQDLHRGSAHLPFEFISRDVANDVSGLGGISLATLSG